MIIYVEYILIQFGDRWACFCGTSYGKYGESDGCNSTCTGDDTEICGDFWLNSVYDVSTKVTPMLTPADTSQ